MLSIARVRPWLLSATGVLAVGAISAAEARAEEDPHDHTIALETLTVWSRRIGRPDSDGDGPYTIAETDTATGLPLAPKHTPQSITAITGQQLKEEGATSIEEALRKTTGVNVVRDSGTLRFQSRGFFMDKIQEDGANSIAPGAQTNPYRSATRLSDIDIYDRIEVLRGPTGLVQGTGEPGGTINLIRKRPTATAQASSTTSVGTWSRYRETIDISGPLTPEQTLRGRLVAVGDRAGSFKDAVEGWHGTLYGVLEGEIAEGTRLRVGGLYEKRREVPDYFGLPMAKDGSDLRLPRATYLGAAWNRLDLEKRNAFFELTHAFDTGWTLDLSGDATSYDAVSPFTGLVPGSGVGRNGLANLNNLLRYDNDSSQGALQAKLQGSFDLFDHEHQIFSGLSHMQAEFDSRYARIVNRSSYNIYSFTGREIAEPNWGDTRLLDARVDYRYRYSETAANFGTQLNPTDRLHAIIGGRFTHYDDAGLRRYAIFGGRPDGTADRDTLKTDKAIPYVGLTYDLFPEAAVYGSYTTIFKPQMLTDANGKLLPPVEGVNTEAGLKSTFLDGRVNAALAFFRIVQKNRGITDIATNTSVADGEVESRGFDAEISGTLAAGWNLFAGYTLNRSRYLKPESASLPAGASSSAQTPVHMVRLHTTYRLPFADGRWGIGGGVQAQSASESIYGIRQSGFAVWDASLCYEFSEATSLQLVVNNVFDRRYYENNRTRALGLNNFYGEPRNVLLTLATRF
jgi:outer-membrane receptor for ferric coprogen and ferric-rhodotorulic acid